ncbi:hypothetical protein [Myxacorys almedinensis]|uniref:Uncharacterized protein n=1 Tax=Myxacorys almedinensis A TaxID=2690445 RepID=A0A8J7Z3B8_9CYAN|nr:hypothetical protein [Myxacorys almedinensis]NDJ18969.1 hypothetical protein [Myxacorys almedinensis A]
MMQSDRPIAISLSSVVGTGAGSGIAIVYILSAIGLIAIGIYGYGSPSSYWSPTELADSKRAVQKLN